MFWHIFFFRVLLSLHHIWYYFNMSTPYSWALDVVFYWSFAIELSTWLFLSFLGGITCVKMVWGDHRKFVITVQKFKWYILQLVLLWFDWYHWYLFILLIIYFSSICNSENYRAIIGNSGTPFRNLSAIHCNHYYYGYIISQFLYLLLTIGFPWSYLFPAQKIRNNTVESPFVILCASTEKSMKSTDCIIGSSF